ncbi:MAG: WD40 repeat domain-containing protein [Treponema sp.]|nr:WD40 repeat domain-containing protein [Treponema sp.]
MKARRIGHIAVIVLFAGYFFMSARPIPLETVLIPCWLNSVESGTPISLNGSPIRTDGEDAIPFSLGNRLGYVSRNGPFFINQARKANVSLSQERWAEYEAEPGSVTIRDSGGEPLAVIENPRGYPFFLDGRIFLINSEQNAISAVGESGAADWTFECAAPLTCVDAAAGLVLAGTLDGIAVVLDDGGGQVFSFEPGGSRYMVILGCAISRDGARIALISGIDDQRFLMLERFGSSGHDFKVIYHEFLDDGFRRPVYVSFIEDDHWVIFERGGGLGFYNINSRQTGKVALNGEISAIDQSGGQGMVFVVISRHENARELIGIRLPGRVIIDSPFISEEVFLGRMESRLIVGGGQILAAFDLEKR